IATTGAAWFSSRITRRPLSSEKDARVWTPLGRAVSAAELTSPGRTGDPGGVGQPAVTAAITETVAHVAPAEMMEPGLTEGGRIYHRRRGARPRAVRGTLVARRAHQPRPSRRRGPCHLD